MGLLNYDEQMANLQRLDNMAAALREYSRSIDGSAQAVRDCWGMNEDCAAVLNHLNELKGNLLGKVLHDMEHFQRQASILLIRMNGLEQLVFIGLLPFMPVLGYIHCLQKPRISIDANRLSEVCTQLHVSMRKLEGIKDGTRGILRKVDPEILSQAGLLTAKSAIFAGLDRMLDMQYRITQALEKIVMFYYDADERVKRKAQEIKVPPPNLGLIYRSSFEDSAD